MERNLNADILKLISIFGVVFIHSSFILSETSFLQFFRDLFRFSVPCFIIIWAFFLEKSYSKKTKKERKKYIWKRFLHLLKVFFIWSTLYFFINVDWTSFKITDIFTKYFSGYGWSGQYFFLILFQLLLMFPLARKIYSIRYIKILTVFIIFLIYIVWGYYYEIIPPILRKLGDRPFIFWLPYVFLGLALARNKTDKTSKYFLFAPILIALEFVIMERLSLQHSEYITLGVLISSMLFSSAILTYKPIKVLEYFQNKILFIGRNTMVIFIVNPLLILILNRLLVAINISNSINDLPIPFQVSINLVMITFVFAGTLLFSKILEYFNLKKHLA